MRPLKFLNTMFENKKNKFNFQFFHVILSEQTNITNSFKSHFVFSNTYYFGPKTDINLQSEVDDNIFRLV